MKRFVTALILVCMAAFVFAAARPSLDGRAVVAEKGDMPAGLFAKTVGYLPGDSVSVTNPTSGMTIEVLILGAIDPSEGVAILLSPEAAEKLGIQKNSNIQVKITKRTGQLDIAVTGTAILAHTDGTIDEIPPENEKDKLAMATDKPIDETGYTPEEHVDTSAEFTDDKQEVEQTSPIETVEKAEEPAPEPQEAVSAEDADFGNKSYIVEDEKPATETPAAEPAPAEEPAAAAEPAPVEEPVASEPVAEEAPPAVEEPAASEPAPAEEPAVAAEPAPVEEPVASEPVAEEAPPAVEEPAPVETAPAAETVPAAEPTPVEESIAAEPVDEEAPPALEEPTPEVEQTNPNEPEADLTLPADEPAKTEEPVAPETPVVEEPIAAEPIPEEAPVTAEPEVETPQESYNPIVLVPTESVAPKAEPVETPVETPKPAANTVNTDSSSLIAKHAVNSLSDLKKDKYYIQIASLTSEENIVNLLKKYSKYPIVLVPRNGAAGYQVLVGPCSVDEYGMILEKFKAFGFKDAFIKKIK